MGDEFPLVGVGVVIPRPVLRVVVVLATDNAIVDEDVLVLGVEQDRNGLTLMTRHVVEVVGNGELVDVVGGPDRVFQHYHRLLVQEG